MSAVAAPLIRPGHVPELETRVEEERVSEQEYFARLKKSETRLEYVQGRVRAMAGGSPTHSRIATRMATAINNRLGESSCEASVADVKVRAEAAEANYFPDVVLFCDNAEWDEERPNVLLSPILIAEVLSESTAETDRTEKLDAYRSIPTLRHYLLVEQRRVRVEHHRRVAENEWRLDIYNWRHDEIVFDDLNVRVPLEELYRRLNVPEGIVLVNP